MMAKGSAPVEDRSGEISLRLLSIFKALIGGATTMEAAEQLGMSQPAISNGLRQLETTLGINLFERLHRRLEPTEEAFQLFREIQPIFPVLRNFETRARAMRLGTSGRLRILSTPPLGHSIAATALGALLRNRPDVSVSYDVRRLEHVLEAVQTGAVDLGIGMGLDSHSAINVEVMASVKMVCILPREHPLSEREVVDAADLSSDELVGIEEGSRLGSAVRTSFSRRGLPYNPRVEVRYCSTAAVLSQAIGAVAVVDPFTAALRNPRQVVRPFTPSCEVPVAILYRRGVPRSRVAQAYLGELRTALKSFEGGVTNEIVTLTTGAEV